MKEKYPMWLKTIGGFLIFFSTIGVNITVTNAAKGMKAGAEEMIRISSVSGNSINEAFYQDMGRVYSNLADVIANGVGVVFVAGMAVSVMLLYPFLVCAAARIAANGKRTEIKCPHCGANAREADSFCPSCGNKIEQNKNE